MTIDKPATNSSTVTFIHVNGSDQHQIRILMYSESSVWGLEKRTPLGVAQLTQVS